MSTSGPSTIYQPPDKRPKLDSSVELRPSLQLSTLTVSQIPTSFKTFETVHFQAIEGTICHELHERFARLQYRLLVAQQSARGFDLVQQRMKSWSSLPKPGQAKKMAQALARMTQSPEITDQAVKDALQYWEAVCIGVAAFSQSTKQCDDILADIMVGDQVLYYKKLVEASERHLESMSAPPSAPVVPNVTPLRSGIPPVQPIADTSQSQSDQYAPYSDEYLREKTSSFIVDKAALRKAIPWEIISDNGSGLKEELAMSWFVTNSGRPEYVSTPPGILLHGDQGTGKTSFIKSFAASKDLVVFQLSSSMHGSLRGQSEKLIQYVFEEIRVQAKQKPCVLMLDEVDSLLGSGNAALAGFEGVIKQCWGDLINDGVACFVFGATNNPWFISMGDYGRRFDLKVHMMSPGQEARKQVIRYAVSRFWHAIKEEDFNDIAAAAEGFSNNDIAQGIRAKAKKVFYECAKAENWVEMDKDGRSVWVPAAEDNPNAKKARMDDLERTEPRPLDAQMIIDFFQSGQVKKTTSAEAEKQHQEWNKKWSD